jgi:hypothetical protein
MVVSGNSWMKDFSRIDACRRNEMERGRPSPYPYLSTNVKVKSTDVDDDGDTVRKGKVAAESTLHDIKILIR